MKKATLILGALALVLGLSQCRKPNAPTINGGNGTQHVVLQASLDNGGSKIAEDGIGGIKWAKGDEITVRKDGEPLNPGTLTCTNAENGTFVGEIAQTTGNITFTFGTQKFDEQTGLLNGAIYLSSVEIEYDPEGSYTNVEMKMPHAVLKLDLSYFGTATSGKTVTISAGGSVVASVTGVTNAANNPYYVAMPTAASREYTFSGNSKTAKVTWKLDKNTYYTKTDGLDGSTGEAIVIEGSSLAGPKSVTTNVGCNTESIYTMGGTVTLPSGAAQQVEYGFVYSKTATESVPEIGKANCTKFVGGTAYMQVGNTSFTVDITGLTPGVTYSVRAYAIGESGAAVHASKSSGIKTITGGESPKAIPSNWVGDPDHQVQGASPYEFTVGETSKGDPIKVRFSQGNLQYVGSAATPYWKFADHQFDFLGTTTGQNSATETVDRDLFGWGTSGQTHGATCYQPWSTSKTCRDYNTYGSDYNHLNSQTPATADWGYNAISNGGNTVNSGWRTLTSAEWGYLLSTANNSKWALGKVGSCTPGLIILPDGWTSCPTGCTFTGGATNYTTNVYSYTQWHDMEEAGAVFLPAGGSRDGASVNGVSDVGLLGDYWSSSYKDMSRAYSLGFLSEVFPQAHCDRIYGLSVRLVR